jgi:hypothetical protein
MLLASCGVVGDLPAATGTEDGAPSTVSEAPGDGAAARQLLEQLEVKGRAPKTGYSREQFGPAWADVDQDGCDSRNQVLRTSLSRVRLEPGSRCEVLEGTLADPYTGHRIHFVRGGGYDRSIDIDHVVALGDAWQKGAQQLTAERRLHFANDPRNLLPVDPSANRQKGDSDAATWLPANKAFRCPYVAAQIDVKNTYRLWVTPAERDAMGRVLDGCPSSPAGVS